MPPFPSHRPSSGELKDAIVRAFWQRISSLDTAISPYPAFRNLAFKPADVFHLLPFLWALTCTAIVQYSQGQPFPLLTIFETSILYSIGLSIPLISQFLWPASQVVIYVWTLYCFRSLPISLPFHLTIFLFPLVSLSLWLFGPRSSLQYFAFLSGYANLMAAMTFILLKYTWNPPAKEVITYSGLFAGINTGLQMVNITYFFPHLKWFGVPLCLLAFLHGGLQDPFGFATGVVTAVSGFDYLIPNELSSVQVLPIPDTSSSLESGIEKSLEPQEILPAPTGVLTTVAAPIDVEHETIQTQPFSSVITTPLPLVSLPERIIEDQSSTIIDSQPTTRLPLIEQEMPQDNFSDSSRDTPYEPTFRARRRPSVGGPREPRHRPRPASIDFLACAKPARRLPTPPQAVSANRLSFSSVQNSTPLPPELQARWNDNLFELQERLGESSSRVTFKVREKRSGLLYVRKTFHSRQTSGNHILQQLFDLIGRQDRPDASFNVVRCYGAYFPEMENDAVRGIFEFCEGGSLHSISNVITQRGAIVGEKVAGRIASGVRRLWSHFFVFQFTYLFSQMLHGLNFLHDLNMVHFNVRPSNVFITQSGMVKLSEPEIPGEGAVALTDRFVKTVGYASVCAPLSFKKRQSF